MPTCAVPNCPWPTCPEPPCRMPSPKRDRSLDGSQVSGSGHLNPRRLTDSGPSNPRVSHLGPSSPRGLSGSGPSFSIPSWFRLTASTYTYNEKMRFGRIIGPSRHPRAILNVQSATRPVLLLATRSREPGRWMTATRMTGTMSQANPPPRQSVTFDDLYGGRAGGAGCAADEAGRRDAGDDRGGGG